eukprot:scaffold1254_cov158-Skeletonema_menzelii.AAC.12
MSDDEVKTYRAQSHRRDASIAFVLQMAWNWELATSRVRNMRCETSCALAFSFLYDKKGGVVGWGSNFTFGRRGLWGSSSYPVPFYHPQL